MMLSRRNTEMDQRLRVWYRNDKPDKPLDDTILQDVKDAIRDRTRLVRTYRIRNTNRSVGTRLSGELAYLYGDRGLPEGTIELRFQGTAGQSFGAFLVNGVRLILTGEANDYVGKGMSGGEIILRPEIRRSHSAQDVIMGNTVLYGATGGSLYASGRAGERFCVRNSGTLAVVEGIGDHGCEYMTNGTVLVLGTTGRNFGAGMTGGTAYVLDLLGNFEKRYNPELLRVRRIEADEEARTIQRIIHRHLERTDSTRAREVLMDWDTYLPLFWIVIPKGAVQSAREHPALEAEVARS
jgi:glutamate synthase (NADPH/NADH) large chain/glutamate synthase (ferredoxin)